MSDKEDLILFLLLLLIVGGSLICLDHTIWCKKGHYAEVKVEASEDVVLVPDGNGGMIPIFTDTPAHTKKVWVCDEH